MHQVSEKVKESVDEDSPLSSKVAMFNNAATKHQEAQHLNPFSQSGGLPKPTFKKGEYGKPIAGSLTEMRGQKANIHVLKEMLELCQIIDSEGYNVKDEPSMKVIPFGELFNIYTYISDKVVGILLRARKHKLIEFEGEVLFQRRDDDVPVFLLKPIAEIRKILEAKQEEIRRSVSPAPQATTVMMDQQKRGVSASPTPQKPKVEKKSGDSQTNLIKPMAVKASSSPNLEGMQIEIKIDSAKVTDAANRSSPVTVVQEQTSKQTTPEPPASNEVAASPINQPTKSDKTKPADVQIIQEALPKTVVTPPTPTAVAAPIVELTPASASASAPAPAPAPSNDFAATPTPVAEEKTDVNNNAGAPTIVTTVEASSNTESEPPADAAIAVTLNPV